ncbi:NUDIX hydrolase [uncultured Microbacterium sp.]|uniref:NUDIX hydrolase n=1 Tax=uncultured Microbacterium sp. TaxID=191216 RepID=UPI0025EA5D73|nr:NUDIX hydrolase [uncultured Microbacterium sp.]
MSGPENGDAWVESSTGERYWGRFGAAGLLAYDPARGVLLQHRVAWSHHGGTWALPGGARHGGESARQGALREAHEEAGVADDAVRVRFESVRDLGVWSYTTVVADVVVPFEPVISDPESLALEWVPVDEVAERPLHPGFAEAWPELRALLDVRLVVVVDAANVVGSVPDGWWKDRAGATARLRDRLAAWIREGVEGSRVALSATRCYPQVLLVVEGQAKKVADPEDAADAACPLRIVRAGGEGDDTIVEVVHTQLAAADRVIAITSDRGLIARIDALTGPDGIRAKVRSSRWLRDQLDSDS